MIAWPRCCPSAWNQLERRVGEDRVVPPGGEQLVLPGTGLVVQVPDPADDQPRGDGLAFGRREGCVPGLGDLSVGDPAIQPVVPDGARVLLFAAGLGRRQISTTPPRLACPVTRPSYVCNDWPTGPPCMYSAGTN